MARAARVAATALAAVLVGAGATLLLALRASLPPTSGEYPGPGLGAPVAIAFDAARRPFVRAESLADALFAQGWLHASERLWQMELLRRVGAGRLSELLGEGLIESDRQLWRAGVPQLAARLARSADPVLLARVERYAAGVNAGIAALGARPPEFLLLRARPAPWRAEDVFAVAAMIAFDSSRNMEAELLRLALASALDARRFAAFLPDEAALPDFPWASSGGPPGSALARLDALDAERVAGLPSASLGSNGWAVAPRRSAGGHALFAFDSHDALALPGLFYEVHLFFGERSLRGGSVAGLPGVISGTTGGVAWGLTNIGDTQDLFLEERHPDDPLRFLGPDGWYRARVEEVELTVRGREAPERLAIVHTRHGPLVSDDPPLALRWTGHAREARGLEALLAMNLARSGRELVAAMDGHVAPSANATWADVDGHVGFRTIGVLPIRRSGDGLVPRRGAERGAGWSGSVAPDRLPSRVDPPAGFVAAANARFAPPGAGPLVSADNAPGYRMRRITARLAASAAHDVESMRALQGDWHDGQAALLLPAMLPALEELADAAGPEIRARDLLVAWAGDPEMRPDLAAPLVFERWYLALAEELFAERLGPDLFGRLLRHNYVLNHALDGLLLARPDSPWWDGAREERLRAAFARAVSRLAGELGADPRGWRWGDRHAVVVAHELSGELPLLSRWLDRGPHPWGGGHATVGRASYRYDRPERADRGATIRLVAEMSRPPRVHAVTPGGQSGHPASPHYADQLATWLARRLDALPDSPEEVAGPRVTLVP